MQKATRPEAETMQVITIYQGASGSGEELAQAVAQSLGYGPIDREVLVEASLQYGIPQAKLTEMIEQEPKWWATFTRRLEPYKVALQAAFCELASNHGIVYHGHLGHELVPKFSHVIKVLLTAPMEQRIKQVQARNKLTDVAAQRYVEEIDKARTRRLMGMFGTDWRDPSRYDLVVNLGYMNLDTAHRLIVAAAHSPEFQVTAASKQAFEDFTLKSRILATLSLSNDLTHGRIDISARNGEIGLSGTIPDWLSENYIVDQVAKIPGVKKVKADLTPLTTSLGLTN
jgi:cytidylate kinase